MKVYIVFQHNHGRGAEYGEYIAGVFDTLQKAADFATLDSGRYLYEEDGSVEGNDGAFEVH